MYLSGDSLYIYSVEWTFDPPNTITYGIVNTKPKKLLSKFITDGTENPIPYNLVAPKTKDIYITDAGNVSPDCFTASIKEKTVDSPHGDIPAHCLIAKRKITKQPLTPNRGILRGGIVCH